MQGTPFDEPTLPGQGGRFAAGMKILGGRFVLERQLGRGGMGEVWLARDAELGDRRALKFLPGEVAHDPKALSQLRREAAAGQRLSHPRIVKTHDLHVGDGHAAVAMEYVDGKTLNELQAEIEKGYFEVAELGGWIKDVCEALAYAHGEAKVVHRDLKPSNIIIERATGRAKVLDFGISRRISETHTQITGKDSSGTMAYSSPQQMDGDKGVPSDDLYALGATLYELLTGSPPFFRGDLRKQILEKVPPSMTERRTELAEEGMVLDGGQAVPSNWEQGVASCLSKVPAKRPADATALWRVLSGETARKMREEEQRKQREVGEQKQRAEEAWHAGAENRRQAGEEARQKSEKDRQHPAEQERRERLAAKERRYTGSVQGERIEREAQEEERGGRRSRVGLWVVLVLLAAVAGGFFLLGGKQAPKPAPPPGGSVQPVPPGMEQAAGRIAANVRDLIETKNFVKAGQALEIMAGYGQVPGNAERVAKLRQDLDAAQQKAKEEEAAGIAANVKKWIVAKDFEGAKLDLGRLADYGQVSGITEVIAELRQNLAAAEQKAKENAAQDRAKANADKMAEDVEELIKANDLAGAEKKLILLEGYELVPGNTERVKKLWWDLAAAQQKGKEKEAAALVRGASEELRSVNPNLDRVEDKVRQAKLTWSSVAGTESVLAEVSRLRSKMPDPPRATVVPDVNSTFVIKGQTFTNSLGMRFVPVVSDANGKKVLFSIYETRRQDYDAYAAEKGGVDASWKSVVFEGKPVGQEHNHPVVCVSWEDANAFCVWLTAREKSKLPANARYRLPTDREWSYAVGIGEREESGGTPENKNGKVADVYPWGVQWPPPNGAGNYDSFSGSSLNTDRYDRTSPVGSFTKNANGIHDMGGNVWEWCLDYYDGVSGWRVLRGGSWFYNGRTFLLSSYRVRDDPVRRDSDYGFRVVLEMSVR